MQTIKKMEQNNADKRQNMQITHPAISAILHFPRGFYEELERLYCTYCLKLGYASSNFERKNRFF